MLRVGFGISAWALGGLDGIGVYTKSLWQTLDSSEVTLQPVVLGSKKLGKPKEIERPIRYFPPAYPVQALVSAATGIPFQGWQSFEREIDFFHATDHHIPKLRRVSVLATVMDLIPVLHPQWAFARLQGLKSWGFRRAISWADYIITISQHSKQDLIERLGIEAARITVIPLGVHQDFFQRISPEVIGEVLQRYDLKKGFFLFIGTLQARKNIERILTAHRQLPPSIRKDHPLVIVGKYGWGSDPLLDQLKALEAVGEGRWLQYVPYQDIFALFQSAQALVYPSLYEGFGLPVLESFASQVPVITSNTTSLPEVAGEAAVLVNPYCIEEITDAMRRLLEDSMLREDLIRRGYTRAQGFTWEQCAQQTLAVYRQIGK